MSDRTQTFIDALTRLEETGDAGPISRLFAANADISNPLVKHADGGEAGAAAFWTTYYETFDAIRSQFRNVVSEGDTAMLEWTSEGSVGGKPVRYGGVSVIEHGDGGITAFRAYFDPTQV